MRYFLLSFLLFFSACSIKNYKHSTSKIIIIKSPKLKFADLAYVRSSGNAVEIELFVAGKSVKKIAINHLICVDEGCITKSSFNKEYLSQYYPTTLLQNIILGHVIYNSKNINKTDSGFEQIIKTNNVNIRYRVNDKTIFFKDIKNRIIFKIKDVQ